MLLILNHHFAEATQRQRSGPVFLLHPRLRFKHDFVQLVCQLSTTNQALLYNISISTDQQHNYSAVVKRDNHERNSNNGGRRRTTNKKTKENTCREAAITIHSNSRHGAATLGLLCRASRPARRRLVLLLDFPRRRGVVPLCLVIPPTRR